MSTYQTSDIQVAAFLVARGHQILSTDSVGDSPRGRFFFPADAWEEANEFFRDGQVSAKRFANAIRELKARIRHATR